MKKLIFGLLPLLTFALAACGGDDKKDSSGGGSGGSGGSSGEESEPSYPEPDPEGTPSDWYVLGDGSFINGGEAWKVASGINLTVNEESGDPKAVTEQCATITFAENDVWKIANGDGATDLWIQMNCVEKGDNSAYADDTSKQMTKVDDGFGQYNVKVLVAGTYDIYFKTYASANPQGTDGYSVWVQVHADAE